MYFDGLRNAIGDGSEYYFPRINKLLNPSHDMRIIFNFSDNQWSFSSV